MKGYYNTSISDILDATGLTKGGLYGHFASKENIWYAVYDEAVTIWEGIVFNGIRNDADPLKRIEKFIENDMNDYSGADVFEGGCFFLNMSWRAPFQGTYRSQVFWTWILFYGLAPIALSLLRLAN